MPTLAWRYLRLRGIQSKDLWIRPPIPFLRQIGIAIIAGFIIAAIYSGTKRITAFFIPENYFYRSFEYTHLIPSTGIGSLLVLIYFSVTAGIVEELCFRGILRKICDITKIGHLFFVILSALLFSTIHWEGGIYSICATATCGIFIAVWFLRSGDLVGAMVAHTVSDLILFS
jgi:membrane protease YdiL (CAAX protease family)